MRCLFAGYIVSTVADTGAGSLRQAIIDSNSTPGPGLDTIGFSSLFNTPQTILIATPLPQMTSPLSIVGSGSSVLTVKLSSAVTTIAGVFSSATTSVALSGMTITGANTSGSGGGLFVGGPGGPVATIDDCVFTGNVTTGFGGGIGLTNNSKLTIRNSKVLGNQAGYGGGIAFFDGGALLMENCTIANNTTTVTTSAGGAGFYFFGTVAAAPPAGFTASTLEIRGSTFNNNTSARIGGGIMVESFIGTLQVQNSTITGNTAATSGGGIGATGNTGTVRVQNTTIAGNTANATATTAGGGGIYRASTMNNALQLTNTIVSGNTNSSAADIRVDMFTTTTANFSAIGNATGFTLAGGSGNNLAYGTNLLLGALANNGGPTQTRAILAGSPLINAGSATFTPAALTTDQRGTGFARVVGGQVDIGAYERPAVAPPIVTSHAFLFETAPQIIRYTFDSNVGASLSAADLQIQNLTTSTTLPTSSVTFAYNATTNTATFTIAAPATGILPSASYRATLFAAGVTNTSGTPLATNDVFDFFFFAGDANHDHVVNFDDLIILAQNYNTAGKTFSQGNFNYNAGGNVNFDDLIILAQQYNKTLAPILAASASHSNIVIKTIPPLDAPV